MWTKWIWGVTLKCKIERCQLNEYEVLGELKCNEEIKL